MNPNRCLLEINQHIATVTLNRAEKLNALDMEMFYAIRKCIKKIKKNSSIRVVILKADGKDFSSGLDVKSVMKKPSNVVKLLWKWWPYHANLAQIVSVGWRQLKVPVIACVQGRCWGGGFQIALGADFLIAHENAEFSIMESRWGLIPDMGGSIALREKAPLDHAMKFAMTAEVFSANKAQEIGVVTDICSDIDNEAQQLALQLLQKSPNALAAIKKLYHNAWHHNDGKLLVQESILQWKMIFSKNRKIAVSKALGQSELDYHNIS